MIDISFKNRTGIKPEVLSAVIGADSFFYGFFSSENQLLEACYYEVASFHDEEVMDQIKKDIFSTEGIECKVSYTGKPYLHNPSDEGGQLIKFFPAFANKHIDRDKLTDQEIEVDYGVSKQQHVFLQHVLGGAECSLFHISTVLANYYYPYSSEKLVAYIGEGKIHLMYAHDQQFIYYNQFNCVNEKDYLYFVLLAARELKLDMDMTVVELAGNVDEDSSIYRLLTNYCPRVSMMRSSVLSVSDFRFRAKQHFYLDLFATAICV